MKNNVKLTVWLLPVFPQNFSNLFGQPLVCLLSPTAYPKSMQGLLFVCFDIVLREIKKIYIYICLAFYFFPFFPTRLSVIILIIYCIFVLLFSVLLACRPVSAWKSIYSLPLQPPHGLPVCLWTEQHALWIVGKGPGTPAEGFPWHWPDDHEFPSYR